jgi:GH24 family phage-related lysozyme (muramidase)
MNPSESLAIGIPFTGELERFVPYPYWDVNGYAIGYGNHYYEDGSPVEAEDNPITKAEGDHLLAFTLNQVSSSVQSLLQVDVTDSMLAALTDLAYNWGVGNFQQSKLLGLINQGADQDRIIAQWQATATTSGGVSNSDLIRRRVLEAELAYSSSQMAGFPLIVGLIMLLVLLTSFRTRGK